MRRRYSTRSRFALSRRWLGRGLRTWGGVVAVAVACSLLATSARAAPSAALTRDGAAGWLLHADSPVPLDQLEAQAAELSKKYRGQLQVLSGAKAAAEAAAARVRVLDRQFDAEHRRLAQARHGELRGQRAGPGPRVLRRRRPAAGTRQVGDH